MAASQVPRERLLSAAVDKAMQGGITGLSLRELAAAIGTSHRMLLYHFGSKEGLLKAVSLAVEQAQRAAVPQQAITSDPRSLWEHFSDPQLWPAERLFFELYAHALLARPGTEGFLDKATEPWLDLMAAAMERQAGLDSASARVEARLGIAVTRGLLLDLLATGDRQAATEAFERYLLHTEHTYGGAARQPEPPGPPE
jgi:AcrR family transcriptional regulator